MAILQGDIKLVTSRVMDDVPEGGGGPTSNVIVDGASNAIFQDISELDRAGGDVSVRKVHVHVQTNNTDTYLGSNIIVAEPPSDPNVSVTLFSTGETFDERDSAVSRVESYLVPGVEWAGFLLENHVAGQRVIQIFQRPTEAPPNIGQTLVLVYREGQSDQRIQYVRVIDTSTVVRTYVNPNDQNKTYEGAVVSCDISDPLREDFPGSSPSPFYQRNSTGTKIRDTSVADAAVYSGVAPISTPVTLGDISATVQTVFTQLVPSAQTEIPLVDQNAAGQSSAVTTAANGNVSYTTSQPFNSTTTLSVGNSITPGTLSIAVSAGATLTDTGGQVYDGATVVGVVDYARGTIAFPTLATPYNGTKTVTFKPAAAPLRVSDTAQTPVTQESRAYNYIVTIEPPPTPGSTLVSYRAQGRWYDLRDDGGGVLRGSDAAYGVGSVNYATGAVAVTLGALPDDGSSIMWAWNSKVNYINRAGATVGTAMAQLQLSVGSLEPGTVTIIWDDGTARSASDNGKGGITGDATGTVNYETGAIAFTPVNLPASSQGYAVNYRVADPAAQKTFAAVDPPRGGDTTITIDLGYTGITPGTVKMDWPVELDQDVVTSGSFEDHYSVAPRATARDDGNGNIIDVLGRNAGTINYATGIVTFQPDGPAIVKKMRYLNTGAANFRYV
jgi:hypothetical protein